MSQHEISILTPVGKHHAAYLPQAWELIRRQQIPAPWLVRWYVQEDGPPSPAQSFVQTLDSKVAQYAASGLSGGAAEARNLALARAHGEMVMLLDADDELAPDAVARVVSQLESGFMWCGFAAVDNQQGTLVQRDGRYSARLSSDATKAPNSDAFVPSEWMGESPRGALRSCWEDFGYLPFHPTTFATYARWIWDVGGWPGLARDEDTALILAISDAHAGVVSSEVNVLYRRHDHQTSQLVPPVTERIQFITRRRK